MNFFYSLQDVKISLERINEIHQMDDENGKDKNVDVTVLNVSKLEKLGPGEYFKPHNPIYIISCEKGVE